MADEEETEVKDEMLSAGVGPQFGWHLDEDTEGSGEMEPTREMIEAGVAVLGGYNDDFESAEDAIRRIWRAMRAHEAMPAIKTGSVVRLNSGGPRMVADTSFRTDGSVDCFWFDGETLNHLTIPADCLTPE